MLGARERERKGYFSAGEAPLSEMADVLAARKPPFLAKGNGEAFEFERKNFLGRLAKKSPEAREALMEGSAGLKEMDAAAYSEAMRGLGVSLSRFPSLAAALQKFRPAIFRISDSHMRVLSAFFGKPSFGVLLRGTNIIFIRGGKKKAAPAAARHCSARYALSLAKGEKGEGGIGGGRGLGWLEDGVVAQLAGSGIYGNERKVAVVLSKICGEAVLLRACATGICDELERLLDSALGSGAFAGMMEKNALEAIVLLEKRMDVANARAGTAHGYKFDYAKWYGEAGIT